MRPRPAPLPLVCRKLTCLDPKAENSVFCPRHRDQKQQANANTKIRKASGLPPLKPGRKPRGHAALQTQTAKPPAHRTALVDLEAAILTRKERQAHLGDEISVLEQSLTILRRTPQ